MTRIRPGRYRYLPPKKPIIAIYGHITLDSTPSHVGTALRDPTRQFPPFEYDVGADGGGGGGREGGGRPIGLGHVREHLA